MSTAFTRRRESREIQTNKNKTQKGLLANIGAPFMLMKEGEGDSDWSDTLILPVEKQRQLMGCCMKP